MPYSIVPEKSWRLLLVVHITIVLLEQCKSFQLTSPLNNGGTYSNLCSIRKSDELNDYFLKKESETPLIVSVGKTGVDNGDGDLLLSPDQILWARQLILKKSSENGDELALMPTADYQENIFDPNAEEKENQHFESVVEKSGMEVPDEFCTTQLQSFLWVVTNAESQGIVIKEEDIIHGANAILRRQALEKWQSQHGKKILALSSDKTEFTEPAKRYKMPKELKQFMLEEIIPNLFSSAVISWEVRDATVVIYGQGDSQVPHLDPCDATILLYLSDGGETMLDCQGGDTCFPLAQLSIPTRRGSGLFFFSSRFNSSVKNKMSDNDKIKYDSYSSERDTGEKNIDELSLHHGGKVYEGEKIVAQIMLDLKVENNIETWEDVLFQSTTN